MNREQQSKALVRIGKGYCGSVWAIPLANDNLPAVDLDNTNIENHIMSPQPVLKRGDGSEYRSVTDEHDIHKHIVSSLATVKAVSSSSSSSNLDLPQQNNLNLISSHQAIQDYCNCLVSFLARAAVASSSPSSLSPNPTGNLSQRNDLITASYQVNIVQPLGLITATSPLWPQILPFLPPDHRPCDALLNERIPPMPKPVREVMAKEYLSARRHIHNHQGRHAAAATSSNNQERSIDPTLPLPHALQTAANIEQNCLVRPLLGTCSRRRYQHITTNEPPRSQQQAQVEPISEERRRMTLAQLMRRLRAEASRREHEEERHERYFNLSSLRNFPLHLDQMRHLKMPVDEYASAMADAMAFLHWGAETDAGGVEFVIARPRQDQASPGAASPGAASTCASGTRPSIGSKPFTSVPVLGGEHALWLLDFDCCRMVTIPSPDLAKEDEEEDGGKKVTEFLDVLARAFWRNDPWYPRPLDPPNGNDKDLVYIDDKKLWERFRGRYITTSRQILVEKGRTGRVVMGLPSRLIDLIVKMKGRWKASAV
ncbi:zinc finger protein-domain-containing protein [Sordaria brevicollis]|uniref:Zinc finger protein-domain-containing protein n=1 Tax=Sordaria brevicollis TaxID=83679 RepID=A0AAE0P2W2_SORBR|nr:zinc finger protein-domain-containing protein [Sordaria brevicollis]